MFNKLKQFKDLRSQAKKIQSVLSDEKAEGSGGWGKVKVTMSGNQEVTGVVIAPELLAADQKEKLEGAIKEATNDVIKKIQKVMAEKIQGMGGLDLPGLKKQ